MLGVLFQGPRCNSKYGKCSYAKMKNSDKIGEKSGKIGDDDVGGVVSGSRVHFHIWKVWLCKNEKW
jgi:hypothetical protein